MPSNDELKYLSREELYSIVNQLKRENECLKTDLIRFKLLSNSYQKLFDKIDEQIDSLIIFNNDILHLKNNIKVLNDFNKSGYFAKIVCIKLNENYLQSINVFNTKSQTNVDKTKTNEGFIQMDFNENNLSDNEISDNQSEGIDNNDIIGSNDETIDGSIDDKENQLSLNCSENLVKSKSNENSLQIPFQPIVIDLTFDENFEENPEIEILEKQINRSIKTAKEVHNSSRNVLTPLYNSGVFKNKYSLREQKDRHLSKVKCDVNGCQFGAISASHMTIHMKTRHSKPFECSVKDCDQSFKSEENLRSHQRINHSIFICGQIGCHLKFNSIIDLDNHRIQKHLPTVLINNSDKTDNIVNQEIASKGISKNYICDRKGCHLKFKSKKRLLKHTLKHSQNMKQLTSYRCNWKDCTKTFKRKRGLNKHKHIMTVHRNNLKVRQLSEAPKKLKECKEKNCFYCKHKYYLQFRCSYCSKRFPNNKRLTSHMVIHSGNARHNVKCNRCHKVFKKGNAMLAHMNAVHKTNKSRSKNNLETHKNQ